MTIEERLLRLKAIRNEIISMFNLTLALTLLFILAAPSPAQKRGLKRNKPIEQSKQSSKTSEPSLDETLAWLKEKIIASAFYNHQSGDSDEKLFTSYKVESINFEGCSVSIKSVYKDSFLTDPTITTTTFESKVALTDLNPSRVEVNQRKDLSERYDLAIHTLNNEPKVQTHMLSQKGLKVRNNDSAAAQLDITFSDKEIADRTAKAFIHAIKLCQLKREPF
jgi:hypothetical protein